ncbi:MAG: Ig-like domain-containing protein [Caldilineaceae bacterium]
MVITTNATNGQAVVNNDGTVLYTPKGNFSGDDSFTYVASDGQLSSDPVKVNVQVTAGK